MTMNIEASWMWRHYVFGFKCSFTLPCSPNLEFYKPLKTLFLSQASDQVVFWTDPLLLFIVFDVELVNFALQLLSVILIVCLLALYVRWVAMSSDSWMGGRKKGSSFWNSCYGIMPNTYWWVIEINLIFKIILLYGAGDIKIEEALFLIYRILGNQQRNLLFILQTLRNIL